MLVNRRFNRGWCSQPLVMFEDNIISLDSFLLNLCLFNSFIIIIRGRAERKTLDCSTLKTHKLHKSTVNNISTQMLASTTVTPYICNQLTRT